MYYCYKKAIISGDVGLKSWGSEPKIWQRVRRIKAPSKAFNFKVVVFEVLGDT